MKRLLLFLLAFAGCAPTLKEDPVVYGYLPDKLVIMDSLLSIIPLAVDTSDDFRSISIDGGSGKQCHDDNCEKYDSLVLPAGTLISDRKAYLLNYNGIMIDDANKRFIIARELFDNYQKNIFVAQKLYDKNVQALEKECKRSWFERDMVYFGFVAGIATAILTEYAVKK